MWEEQGLLEWLCWWRPLLSQDISFRVHLSGSVHSNLGGGLPFVTHWSPPPPPDPNLPKPTQDKISAPVALNKATINCTPVWRAQRTMAPTQCPSPQTRLETNVTGISQNGIIRTVSLNTFTYLRAHSGPPFCFISGKKEPQQRGNKHGGKLLVSTETTSTENMGTA